MARVRQTKPSVMGQHKMHTATTVHTLCPFPPKALIVQQQGQPDEHGSFLDHQTFCLPNQPRTVVAHVCHATNKLGALYTQHMTHDPTNN